MEKGIVASAASVRGIIDIPPGPAWEMLSAFKGIEEFSPIAKCQVEGEGEGAKRTCIMPDGTAIKERLIRVDHQLMELAYEMLESPLPVTHYKAFVHVTPEGTGSCEVHYSSTYLIKEELEEEVMLQLRGVYTEIIYGLERYIKVA